MPTKKGNKALAAAVYKRKPKSHMQELPPQSSESSVVPASAKLSEEECKKNNVENPDLQCLKLSEAHHVIPSVNATATTSSSPAAKEPTPVEAIATIPDDHKCFGTSPTIYEFAKHAVIHNVNNQKMESVLSKSWKIRCTECTDKCAVNDETTEFLYCRLTIQENNYFMIKLNESDGQLFLIDTENFKALCSMKYAEFVCITREHFNALGDLGLAIENQKAAVLSAYCSPVMAPYKSNGCINFEKLKTCPPEVANIVREIGRLYFLELQIAIGVYMCTVVDASELHEFVMKMYEERGPMYRIIKKEAVENIYETLFKSLISESDDL